MLKTINAQYMKVKFLLTGRSSDYIVSKGSPEKNYKIPLLMIRKKLYSVDEFQLFTALSIAAIFSGGTFAIML